MLASVIISRSKDDIFFVLGRRVCADCFSMFVIGPQARTGDGEAEEVEVSL